MPFDPRTDKGVLIESGVDYITATCSREHNFPLFLALSKTIARSEVKAGCEESVWRTSGYRGIHAGSVDHGIRQDGAILRISGRSAQDHYSDVLQCASNITRLDVQLTLRYLADPKEVIAYHFRKVRAKEKERKRPRNYHGHITQVGLTGFELGNRQGEQCGRVYDKFEKSQDEWYRGCVRFEREVHDKLAVFLTQQLVAADDPESLVDVYVRSWLRSRHVELPQNNKKFSSSRPHAGVSDQGVSLRWIANSLGRISRGLVRTGRGEDLLMALGLEIGADRKLRVRDTFEKL